MKNSYLTVTDQFCGAGGSSQGVRRAAQKMGGGLEVKLALNHWKLAIETHNTNFPDTRHECTDISACDPRRYPSTDILITSPECTNHSIANGKKKVIETLDLFNKGILDAAAERSRATMWDVCRFAEFHKYNIIIVENVVDARKWVMWHSWLHAMHALGYNHRCVYANSMHFYPTPQSRDRMYVVFWKKGNKAPNLDHTPLAYCPCCGKDVHAVQTWKRSDKHFGKYKTQYNFSCPVDGTTVEPYYYASFNCIDWSDKGTRIGDRKKPLSENTINRIQYGIDKYEKHPFVFHAAYGKEARGVVRPVTDTFFTQTTFTSQAILNPPFIIKGEHTLQEGYVKNVREAFQTQTVRQSMSLVVPPFIVENKGQSKSKSITDPLPCQTTKPYLGILTDEAWNSFIAAYYSTGNITNHITESIGTVNTTDRHCIINYQKPSIDDCYYRMLKPSEIKLAMAFDKDYIILGNSKDQVKQLGNAVTPPVMEWLVERCVESLS